MNSFRFIIAISVGKIIKFILNIFNKRGGSLPGKLALKIYPNILEYFCYPKVMIAISGTNGKTTTTNMLYQLLKNKYPNAISNILGDNLLVGIISLFINNCNYQGIINSDCIILEIDELTLIKINKDIKFSHIIITNLFRDQLDRVGEMEFIINKFINSLIGYQGKLIINGDDPNVYRIAYNIIDRYIIGVN